MLAINPQDIIPLTYYPLILVTEITCSVQYPGVTSPAVVQIVLLIQEVCIDPDRSVSRVIFRHYDGFSSGWVFLSLSVGDGSSVQSLQRLSMDYPNHQHIHACLSGATCIVDFMQN